MWCEVISKRAAISFTERPLARRRNISRTISDEILHNGCFSPDLTPILLPFFVISAILSKCVPIKRWDGLTQDRTSQECKTNRSLGNGPTKNSQATRCESSVRPSIANWPYPSLLIVPVHIQHPDIGQRAIRASKRSAMIDFGLAIAELLAELVIGQEPVAH